MNRHPVLGPLLPLRQTFYPLGFPVEVSTNAAEILDHYQHLWGKFVSRHQTTRVHCHVSVVEGQSPECPPEPSYRMLGPLMIFCADRDNYTVSDLPALHTEVVVTRNALRHPLYVDYFLLQAPLVHLSTAFTTPIHGACVSLGGRGVLLCGESGAGKSTLAFACARNGWTYTTDDASFLLHVPTSGNREDSEAPMVIGNCHQARFRPESASLFPELEGCQVTPRAAGKPSIEIDTTDFGLVCSEGARVKYVVFLRRHGSAGASLTSCAREIARHALHATLFAPMPMRTRQHDALEKLLTLPVFELAYRDLDDAVALLRTMIEERS